MVKNTVTMQLKKDGKVSTIGCHPGQVENMKRQGWEEVKEKPAAKVEKS